MTEKCEHCSETTTNRQQETSLRTDRQNSDRTYTLRHEILNVRDVCKNIQKRTESQLEHFENKAKIRWIYLRTIIIILIKRSEQSGAGLAPTQYGCRKTAPTHFGRRKDTEK